MRQITQAKHAAHEVLLRKKLRGVNVEILFKKHKIKLLVCTDVYTSTTSSERVAYCLQRI